MEIDIAQLAAQTAAFLTPFLPYLIKGGKIAAKAALEKAGEIFTEEAWERAEKLWARLKPKAEDKLPEAAITRASAQPENQKARDTLQNNLEFQLEDIFNEDSSIARFVAENITIAKDRSVIGRDFKNAQIATGDRNVLIGSLQVYFDSQQIKSPAEQEKVQKAYHSYLEKLRRHCNALPLAALGGEESSDEEITLDKIYIDLDTTQFKEAEEKRSTKQGIREPTGLIVPLDKTTPPISVMEAAIETHRLVLLGDAGAGKSTFVKELFALQAAVLLGERKEPLEGFDPDLIPVLIVLRDLAPKLAGLKLGNLSADDQQRALSGAVLEKIHEDISSYKAAEFIPVLDEAIENGKVLLALDGLDEVPQDLRVLVRRAAGALIQIHAVDRIIITSRSRSYTGQAVFQNFQPYTIAPFDEEKIKKFSRAWYNERHSRGHIQADQVEPRSRDLANAATDPDLIKLSSNPMMLTSIALLHQRDIGLPRERVKLYHLIVNVFSSRWQKYKTGEENVTPSAELAKFLKDDNRLRAALEVLAYECHRAEYRTKGENNSEVDLSRGHALSLLERTEYLGDPALASEFLDYVDQRAGLLVGKGGELERPTSYHFPHRTIQEYLAGCYLIGKRDRGREFYKHAAEGDFWSLAALMGAEELFYNHPSTRDALLDLTYDLCPDGQPQSEQAERALLWSGQFACLLGTEIIERDTDKPSGGKGYLQRLIPRTLSLLESHLAPRERAEAGDTLAKLGDPRTGVTTNLLFCEIPAGKFIMGSSKKNDKDAFEDEEPQFEYNIKRNYFMSRYPITNAQFDLFVNDPEGYVNEKWYTDSGMKWLTQAKQDKPPKSGGAFDLPNHPVVNITWYEAVAYTRWLTNKMRSENTVLKLWDKDSIKDVPLDFTKWEVRLPAEAEWEKAGRGENGLRFPWGDDFVQEHVNNNMIIGSTSAVGCFPKGESQYGLLDMSGNVWEWCATQSTDGYKNYVKNENNDLEGESSRVLRGGAFGFIERFVRCAYRFRYYPFSGGNLIGFRVVVVASPISL